MGLFGEMEGEGQAGKGGGTVLPTPSGGGGGVYWNGTMWVATPGPLVITGNGSGPVLPVQINGLSGSPDVLPPSPGVHNDEFDQDFNGVSSPWTNFGTPAISNTSDALSHVHLQKAGATAMAGIFQAAPSAPFTVTCKLVDCYLGQNTNRAALVLSSLATPAASSGTLVDLGLSQTSSTPPLPTVYSNQYTGFTGAGSAGMTPDTTVNTEAAPPMYFRVLVTDSTHWTPSWSKNGLLWNVGSVFSAGFVPLAVCLAVNAVGAVGRGEAFFDWIRFT
jgi:hypothetical protein